MRCAMSLILAGTIRRSDGITAAFQSSSVCCHPELRRAVATEDGECLFFAERITGTPRRRCDPSLFATSPTNGPQRATAVEPRMLISASESALGSQEPECHGSRGGALWGVAGLLCAFEYSFGILDSGGCRCDGICWRRIVASAVLLFHVFGLHRRPWPEGCRPCAPVLAPSSAWFPISTHAPFRLLMPHIYVRRGRARTAHQAARI